MQTLTATLILVAFTLTATAGPTIVACILFGLLFVATTVRWPLFGMGFVLVVACVTPYWWGVTLFGYLPFTSVAFLLTLPGLILRRLRMHTRLHWTGSDILLAIFSVLILTLAVFHASMYGHVFVAVMQWLPAYVAGRLLIRGTSRVTLYRLIGIAMALLAVIAIVEFVTQWNPYFGTAPLSEQYAKIGDAQIRGGMVRTEWAFGHSIALGNSIAMGIPFLLASRMPRLVIIPAVSVMVIAVSLTFSRSALTTAVIAVALVVWSQSTTVSRRLRAWLVLSVVLAGIVVIPLLTTVFDAATREAARSANHRLTLIEMIGHLNSFGTANGYWEQNGVFSWYGIVSIDNTFIRIGVNFGVVAAIISLLLFLPPTIRALTRKPSIEDIAVVSVLPALFTVALITQFGILVWFFLGLSAASAAQVKARRHNDARLLTISPRMGH